MKNVIINFVLIFVIMCFQLISINAEVKIDRRVSTSLLRQKLEAEEPIRLNKFFDVNAYVSAKCHNKCKDVLAENNAMYSFHCNETIDDLNAQSCEEGQWILKQDEADLGKQSGDKQCTNPLQTFGDNYECVPCYCVIKEVNWDYRPQVVRTLDTMEKKSDLIKNKVVTGIKFRVVGRIIVLEIQQATLLYNGEVDNDKKWMAPNEFPKVIIKSSEDLIDFSYRQRTMFLDEILVPKEYVVTGVKLAPIGSSEGLEGVKMQIKGTKYDSSFRLINGTDKWFDYQNNNGQEISYKRNRTEIPLSNCDDPIRATNNTEIKDTNRFVRFRGTDIKKDGARHAIPYFSSEPAELNDKRPLRGIGLSYKGQEGYGGYIFFKVFHHDSVIFTRTKSPIGAPKNTSTFKHLDHPEIWTIGPMNLIHNIFYKRFDTSEHSIPAPSTSTELTITTETWFSTSPINSDNSNEGPVSSDHNNKGNSGTNLHFQYILLTVSIYCLYL